MNKKVLTIVAAAIALLSGCTVRHVHPVRTYETREHVHVEPHVVHQHEHTRVIRHESEVYHVPPGHNARHYPDPPARKVIIHKHEQEAQRRARREHHRETREVYHPLPPGHRPEERARPIERHPSPAAVGVDHRKREQSAPRSRQAHDRGYSTSPQHPQRQAPRGQRNDPSPGHAQGDRRHSVSHSVPTHEAHNHRERKQHHSTASQRPASQVQRHETVTREGKRDSPPPAKTRHSEPDRGGRRDRNEARSKRQHLEDDRQDARGNRKERGKGSRDRGEH